MDKLIDIAISPVAPLLDLLLKDKSTKKNIIWATDTYEELGYGFSDKEHIKKNVLIRHLDVIQPRIKKRRRLKRSAREKKQRFLHQLGCAI